MLYVIHRYYLCINNLEEASMSVNFEYYKVFYYVATAGSIAAAAKTFLTQPTISHYIQSLEKELDCSLFLRTKRCHHDTQSKTALFAYRAGLRAYF